jgi:poly-gamma-glutamate synthesis protein (capsule biosynthesis protein)
LFENSCVEKLFGKELLDILASSDIRILNLEVPLADKETPIEKCGPNLIAPVNTINGIKAINPTVLGLANNHILDQGQHGLASTMEVLRKHDILYVGAGNNLQEAAEPLILTYNDKTIGIYCCAEHEFTIATETSGGANPFDTLTSFDHIKATKEKCDYVIVLFHGGKEHYQYPSPNVQAYCRKMVENGADLIVCQHSHCIGCEEDYRGARIIYGQGNFIFDRSKHELCNTGLLVKVVLSDTKVTIEYIPIERVDNKVRMAHDKLKQEILYAFILRSKKIYDESFVKNSYTAFAVDNASGYLVHGVVIKIFQLSIRIIKKLLGKNMFYKLCSKKLLLSLLNVIECEAHRELFITGLKSIINE